VTGCTIYFHFISIIILASKSHAALRQVVLLCIYSNCYMSCVYVDWLLAGSIRILPTAFIWVVAFHRLFLYPDPPPLCHPPCDWLSLF